MTAKKRQAPGAGSIRKVTLPSGRTVWEWSCTVRVGGTAKRLHKRARTWGEAKAAMDEALTASRKKTYSEPSKQPFGEYLAVWLDGLQHAPSTVASYRKNVRLHVVPYDIGTVELGKLTSVDLDALYAELLKSGRRDGKGQGLSARTVRYVHTIISAALRKAVKARLIPANPAADAEPPTAKAAKAPEMHPWTAGQLGAFLGWAKDNSELYPAWYVLAFTGMRRGELLALRWRDIDFASATVTIKRSAGLVRNAGEGARIDVGPTKTERSVRTIDIDDATVAVLKSWKSGRGTMHLALAGPDALAFGDSEGQPRHPERFSRLWNQTLKRAIAAGIDIPPIRLHDLRHTHATVSKVSGVASAASFGGSRERRGPGLRGQRRAGWAGTRPGRHAA